MGKMTMVEAINMAHAFEMAQDPSVVVLGEDVGVNGGVFRATAGLQQRFGKARVQDTPLAEGLIAGAAIGMAASGLKPVAEIQFMGFIYPALDQIASHMARLRNRSRGRLTCPLVLRMPHGGGIHAPEHHSESLEALLCHHPGLRVVCPSSPARAYGLLLAAIRDPGPRHVSRARRLYRFAKQEVEDDGQALPIGRCFVLRDGTDLTIVTWGAMTIDSLKAAEQMGAEGVSCEVIDVSTLAPIDFETILDSVVEDRPSADRARSRAHRRPRRRDRGHRGRAGAVRSGRPDPPRDRLRHHHAALPARARLHTRRRPHPRRHPGHTAD